MKFPFIRRNQITRSRLIVFTLACIAIIYILFRQIILRPQACTHQMCPVNDISYIYQMLIVICLSVAAMWLLKPSSPQS